MTFLVHSIGPDLKIWIFQTESVFEDMKSSNLMIDWDFNETVIRF